MTPYLTAYQEYQKHNRGVTWTDALDFHFQHGVVISTPVAFLMARPVRHEWPDDIHASLSTFGKNWTHDCWHIWAAAGSLPALFEVGRLHRRPFISFQRHGQARVRRVNLRQMFDRMMERQLPDL